MNTTARLESTGARDKIQLSQETADLLLAAGKSHWIRAREEKVNAKGKGELQTYWLEIGPDPDKAGSSTYGSSASNGSSDQHAQENAFVDEALANKDVSRVRSDRMSRLIDWNVEVLLRMLKTIVARRDASQDMDGERPSEYVRKQNQTALEEVKEIIALPGFDGRAARQQKETDQIYLSNAVIEQLHDYVTNIAIMYVVAALPHWPHPTHTVQVQ